MAEPDLNLHLCVDVARVAECAAALQQRLRPRQWQALAQLAAEIVRRWETTGPGSSVLLIAAAATELEAAAKAGLAAKERLERER